MGRAVGYWGLYGWALALAGLGIGRAPADEPPGNDSQPVQQAAADKAVQADKQARARQWVTRLGADDYREREAAARQLLALGPSARPALQKGLQSPDLEVRVRSWSLLQEILHSGFEAELKAFVAGVPGATPPTGWDRFRSVVEDQPAARRLYAEMFRRDGDLIHAAIKADRTSNWISQLQRKISEVRSNQMAQMKVGTVRQDKETLALLLFLTSDKCLPEDDQAYSPVIGLYSLLSYPASDLALRDPIMLKLLDAWAMGRSEGRTAYYVLEICLRKQRMKAAEVLSRKVLQSSDARSNTIPLAAMVVAKAGDLKDVPLLERHLNNSNRFTNHHNARIRKEPIPIEVRDIVLAMLVHMTGQKIEDYGYKHARPDPVTVYSRYSLLFLSDAERDQALKKWMEWRKAHPKLGVK